MNGRANGDGNGCASAFAVDSPVMCLEEAAAVAAADAAGAAGDTAFVEVFVGGLAGDTTDDSVRAAFEAVGSVASVRLNRRKNGDCKAGFVRFGDPATAERACHEVKEVDGKPVGIHILRARAGGDSQEQPPPEADDLEADIARLLRTIRGHTDRRGALAAALRAVSELPPKSRANSADRPISRDSTAPASDGSGREGSPGRAGNEEAPPDPATFLEAFPRCKRLVDTFRSNPNTHNKTPLAILHEYATRLSLEFVYDETAESNLGPFTVEAKLTSVGGAVLYAKGQGRGRGKKDAKQVAAAAVLEQLLASVPEADFLQPGKAKVTKVNPRGMAGSGRAALLLRGRGRGRWLLGRSGRPVEYAGGSAGLPPPPGDYGQLGGAYLAPQDGYDGGEAYGLPGLSADAQLRTFLASQPHSEELLRSLRGHSLDATALANIQRQLAGLPLGQDVALGIYGNSQSFDNSRFSFRPTEAEQQALQQQLRGHLAGLPPPPQLGAGPQALASYGLPPPYPPY